MRDERFGRGASSNHIHHWCLDFDEAPFIHEFTKVGHDSRAHDEFMAGGGVDNQVEITLTETRFFIPEAIKRFRDGVETG